MESQRLTVSTPIAVQTPNVAAKFNNNGFNIPDIFNDSYGNCTIEFWVKPQSLKNWNLQAGRWGQFMFHANEDGEFTAGWDAVGEKRVHAYGALKVGRWNHIAMVVNRVASMSMLTARAPVLSTAVLHLVESVASDAQFLVG